MQYNIWSRANLPILKLMRIVIIIKNEKYITLALYAKNV